MNRESVTVVSGGTYPDHGEEDAGGSEGGFCVRNITSFLGNVQNLNVGIQGRGDVTTPIRLWGVCSHRRDKGARKKTELRGCVESD